MKMIWVVWMMEHMSAHGERQVPRSTGRAGMSIVVQHYILHEHARHSPDCTYMSSRLPRQHCSMMVISVSLNTQQARNCRFRVDKDTEAAVVQSLQQQPSELFMEVIHKLVCWLDDSLTIHGDYLVARTIHVQFGLNAPHIMT
jgi:hypothetical protein